VHQLDFNKEIFTASLLSEYRCAYFFF